MTIEGPARFGLDDGEGANVAASVPLPSWPQLGRSDPDPLRCSPARPWGIHPNIMRNICPRCGWIARPELQGSL